ncbi:hypothetical protein RCG47_05525 [Staphylococcus simulans]|uniref:hypothetical protein n=1 Tax=Staphylococcus simulans TaxID=1286 RepID=UPI0015F7B32C|nr:hypothetical protein [Staphylococcus simulans]MCE5023473.1 hypothetical protein [Staphylococcus simulans]MDQ7113544.1 hypothetical protein [Staphylococcus simulans]MDQ7114518.1 hypothetical protein [Staphylococcus simulans]MDQ7117175.1 hypothetical protein [Staphylococcus simulans]MDQ7140489.1 hypothetical protein [Staphylococcus simulans]
MNNDFLTGLYTLAGGVVLYTVKEVIRFLVDTNLNRKQANLNNIYPIYSEVYKAAKIFIGSYATPILQPETLRYEDIEVMNKHSRQKRFIDAYKLNSDYRYLINLTHHLEKMRDFKKEFNNSFSVNQFCFDDDFIKKTKKIDAVMNSDLSYLEQQIQYHLAEVSSDIEGKIINKDYKDNLIVYERYLDDFNKVFKKKFKI